MVQLLIALFLCIFIGLPCVLLSIWILGPGLSITIFVLTLLFLAINEPYKRGKRK